MSSRFQPARDAFGALAAAFAASPDLADDVRHAMSLLLTRYNTQIFENRFLVGGVTERIIAAAFVAMGRVAMNYGVQVTRTDIRVGDASLSIKGSFRPNAGNVRLVNVMGRSTDAVWNEATVFVISKKGIGYADPELLPGATSRAEDAITLGLKPLFALWNSRPEMLVPMDLPYSREQKEGSDIASRIVADEILRYTKCLKPFDRRSPAE